MAEVEDKLGGIRPWVLSQKKIPGDKDAREFLFAGNLPEVIERCFAETSQSLVQV
jgi:hypothetical protein